MFKQIGRIPKHLLLLLISPSLMLMTYILGMVAYDRGPWPPQWSMQPEYKIGNSQLLLQRGRVLQEQSERLEDDSFKLDKFASAQDAGSFIDQVKSGVQRPTTDPSIIARAEAKERRLAASEAKSESLRSFDKAGRTDAALVWKHAAAGIAITAWVLKSVLFLGGSILLVLLIRSSLRLSPLTRARTVGAFLAVSLLLGTIIGARIVVKNINNYPPQAVSVLLETVGPQVLNVIRWSDAFEATTVCLLAASLVAVLWVRGTDPVFKTFGQRASILRRQLSVLRSILYATMVLLMADVVFTSAIMQWPVSFIDPERKDVRDGLAHFATGIVTVRGFFDSILLGAMFVPAAVLLRVRLFELATNAIESAKKGIDTAGKSPPLDENAWLEEHKLTDSWLDRLKPFLAIIAPLLTAPFTDIVTHLYQ